MFCGPCGDRTDQLSFGLASSIFITGPGLLRDVKERDGAMSVLRSDVPVLILHGGEDNLTRPSGSEKLAQAIAHEVEVNVIPHALHEVHCELPEHGRTVYFDKLVAFAENVFKTSAS